MTDELDNQAPVLIAGAGLTGLCCAYHLQRPYHIWEKESDVGGLARTRRTGGFCFDYTGHWLHTRKAWTRQFITETLGIELVEIERRAAIHCYGVRTNYPFQAHTHGLPTAVVAECLLGYFAARERRASGLSAPVHSFADYIREQLGEGIAKHFMIPYNTKLWTVPPEELSAKWCKRFVPQPEPDEVVYGALRPEGIGHGLGYNNTFLYPPEGGIGTLPTRIGEVLGTPASLKTELVTIDHKARVATNRAGDQVRYRALVSTIPLPALVAKLVNPPARIREAAEQLRSATVTFWNIAFKGADKDDAAHWMYFPEEAFPFYRIGSPSAVLPSLAPLHKRSFWVEVSHRSGTSLTMSDETILEAMGRAEVCAPGEEPILMERHSIPCAYVLMDSQVEEPRTEILEWLREVGIFSAGRYGAWTYHSMEDSMLAGKATAHQVEEYCGSI